MDFFLNSFISIDVVLKKTFSAVLIHKRLRKWFTFKILWRLSIEQFSTQEQTKTQPFGRLFTHPRKGKILFWKQIFTRIFQFSLRHNFGHLNFLMLFFFHFYSTFSFPLTKKKFFLLHLIIFFSLPSYVLLV